MEGRPGGVGQLEGLDLGRLLAAGPLSPAQAAAVGLGILSALEDLHESGRSAGSLTPDDVVIRADGRVRLRRGGQEHASSSELAEDVRQAGRVICTALAISVEPEAGVLRPAERAMPAVAATVRAIANGAMGRNVALARAQFADTAGSLVAPERLRLSETELAEHVRAAPVPPVHVEPAPASAAVASEPVASVPVTSEPELAVVPAPRPRSAPAAPTPRFEPARARPAAWESQRRVLFDDEVGPDPRAGRMATITGVIVILVVAGVLGAYVLRNLMVNTGGSPIVTTNPSPAVRAATPSPQSPQSTPSTAPTGATTSSTLPTYAPPAQGTIKSVGLALNGGCAVGSSCALEITLNFTKAPADTDYAWTYKAFDPCTGTTSDVSTGHFTAKAGWIQIISDRTVTLPATRGQLYVVAVTTSPDQAQSPAIAVGQRGC